MTARAPTVGATVSASGTASARRRRGSRTTWRRTSGRSTPARSTPSPSGPTPRASPSWCASAATAPTSSAVRTGPRSPRTCRPTSSPWSGPRSSSPPRRGTASSATDPDSGLPVLVRSGRFGPYVQLGEAVEGGERPRTASLFRTMTPETVDARPGARAACACPARWAPTRRRVRRSRRSTAASGPYRQEGHRHPQPRDRGAAAQRHPRRGAGAVRPAQDAPGTGGGGPLRELGEDPETGAAVVVRSGRFGPYVTDGTTNASLRKGDEPETITIERAAELLADRRAAGPPVEARRAATKASKVDQEDSQEGDQGQEGGQEDHEDGDQEGSRQAGKPRPRRPPPATKASTGDARDGVSGRGRLIALEGVDGCGKSTQAVPPRRRHRAPLSTAEPGATALGAHVAHARRSTPTLPPRVANAPRPCSWRPTGPSTWPRSSGPRSTQGAGSSPTASRGRRSPTRATGGASTSTSCAGWCRGRRAGSRPDLTVLARRPRRAGPRPARIPSAADRLERLDAGFHERVRRRVPGARRRRARRVGRRRRHGRRGRRGRQRPGAWSTAGWARSPVPSEPRRPVNGAPPTRDGDRWRRRRPDTRPSLRCSPTSSARPTPSRSCGPRRADPCTPTCWWVRPAWASGPWCGASRPRCCARRGLRALRGVPPGPGRGPPRPGGGRAGGRARERRRRPARGAPGPAPPARGAPSGDRGVATSTWPGWPRPCC